MGDNGHATHRLLIKYFHIGKYLLNERVVVWRYEFSCHRRQFRQNRITVSRTS